MCPNKIIVIARNEAISLGQEVDRLCKNDWHEEIATLRSQ